MGKSIKVMIFQFLTCAKRISYQEMRPSFIEMLVCARFSLECFLPFDWQQCNRENAKSKLNVAIGVLWETSDNDLKQKLKCLSQ